MEPGVHAYARTAWSRPCFRRRSSISTPQTYCTIPLTNTPSRLAIFADRCLPCATYHVPCLHPVLFFNRTPSPRALKHCSRDCLVYPLNLKPGPPHTHTQLTVSVTASAQFMLNSALSYRPTSALSTKYRLGRDRAQQQAPLPTTPTDRAMATSRLRLGRCFTAAPRGTRRRPAAPPPPRCRAGRAPGGTPRRSRPRAGR